MAANRIRDGLANGQGPQADGALVVSELRTVGDYGALLEECSLGDGAAVD